MCTVLFRRETLEAEGRSEMATQKLVDELIVLEKENKINSLNKPKEYNPKELKVEKKVKKEAPSNKSTITVTRTGHATHERGAWNSESFSVNYGIYVWFDSHCYGNGKKGFYYVRRHPARAHILSTYDFPKEIIQKNKLRPEQVEFMERKCQETSDEAQGYRKKYHSKEEV